MKKAIMVGLAAIAGLAAGCFAGYKYAEKKVTEQCNEHMNDELEKVRKAYEVKLAEMRNSNSVLKAKVDVAYNKVNEVVDKASEDEEIVDIGKNEGTDYTRYFGGKEEPVIEKKVEKKRTNHSDDIEYPSDRDFYSGTLYPDVSFRYFTEDNVLVDDEGREVDMIEYIGLSGISHVGDYEEDVLYVRNHNLKLDICVYQEYGKFYRDRGD